MTRKRKPHPLSPPRRAREITTSAAGPASFLGSTSVGGKEMNRTVVLTIAALAVAVGFAMCGEDQEAQAGLFGKRKCCKPACCEPAPEPTCCETKCGGRQGLFARLKARKCKKADCCEPEPCCCEPASCCEPAPCCAPEPSCCDPAPCGCEAAAPCGCEAAAPCGCEAAAPCGCEAATPCGCGAPAAADCGCGGTVVAPAPAEEAAPEAPAAPEGDATT